MKSEMQPHTPVLLAEILEMVKGLRHSPRWGLDATFGRGGHARAILEMFPELKMIGLDRDQEAISYGESHIADWGLESRLILQRGNFHDFKKSDASFSRATQVQGGFDFILIDLGVSSPQLDDPKRGFSFYHEGPLDMRMSQVEGPTAADIVNTWSEAELNELFQEYGEVRRPQRTVRMIVEQRSQKKLATTTELSNLIERAEGWRRKGHHPATRYFLALRMQVNRELEGLRGLVPHLVEGLVSGGRLMIITFHSLEDRIIKYALKEHLSAGRLVNKKVIVPGRDECRKNVRARSAKLRVFEKG